MNTSRTDADAFRRRREEKEEADDEEETENGDETPTSEGGMAPPMPRPWPPPGDRTRDRMLFRPVDPFASGDPARV